MAAGKIESSNGHGIKLSSFKRSKNGKYTLAVKIGAKEEAYNVSVNDTHGIFALDLPTDLALKLREFPIRDSKVLMANVREQHKLLTQS